MVDPYRIQGPAIISFSGGRTSGFMLRHIILAHGGELPDDVHVVFSNTGKELEATLEFVRDCAERWNVNVRWLEYADAERPADRWREVTFETASRNGEPFEAAIGRKNYLPNPATRFCTQDLKIHPVHYWASTIGIGNADRVLGLRADEPERVMRMRGRQQIEERQDSFDFALADRKRTVRSSHTAWECVMPLAATGVRKEDVVRWWGQQNFNLRLPTVNGVTPGGNCDLCYLKGASLIMEIMAQRPDLARWWIDMENRVLASKPSGARFRNDRPSYAEMLRAVQEQERLDFGDRDHIVDCICGDAA